MPDQRSDETALNGKVDDSPPTRTDRSARPSTGSRKMNAVRRTRPGLMVNSLRVDHTATVSPGELLITSP